MDSRHPIRRTTDLHLMEERIAAQRREIQNLLHDNQLLAATHVTLKQDVAAAQDDLRRLSATASSVKADRDIQVREIYERALKSETEARSIDGLHTELGRVRADINELRAERKALSEKLNDIHGEISRAQMQLRQLPELKSEIESTQRDIQRGKAAIEYERKMHLTNFELNEALDKHVVLVAREAKILRAQLENESRFDFVRY
ncbi:hypothetical protein CASFOL_032828 [Castilleja foliolosa]|uniref:Uncharacterized protein n=1 Tax=Castilleja foliolosa TaxID=1961234 RepID=A0ABD3C387_9LAMI